MQNKNNKKAFTLAEVLVTLSILGVLIAISAPVLNTVIPNFNIYRVKKINTTLKNAIDDMLNNNIQYEGHDFANTGYGLVNNDVVKNTSTFRIIFTQTVDMKNTLPCRAHGENGGVDLNKCYVSTDNMVWAILETDFEKKGLVCKSNEGEYEADCYTPITVYPEYKEKQAKKDRDGYMKEKAVFYGVRRDGKVIFLDEINCENNPKSMQCLAMKEISSSKMKRR